MVSPSRRRPRTTRAATRRRPAAVGGIGLALFLFLAGCVGQKSRNDDEVGPYSYRPDAREHTLGPHDSPDGR